MNGLGKTIQAIGLINCDPSISKVLVVCPASLRINWRRELKKWLIRDLQAAFATGSTFHAHWPFVTIMNYDILARHHDALRSVLWDMVIADEAHLLKNPKAKRTIALLGQQYRREYAGYPEVPGIPGVKARRAVFLTGTPIPNKAEEGYPIFHYLDPAEFSHPVGYRRRFCEKGSIGLNDLQVTLRSTIMIRRLKKDVLTELPAKRRAIIEIPSDDVEAVAVEREAWEAHEERMEILRAAVELAKASGDPDDYPRAVAALKKSMGVAFAEMSKVRHDTAVAKIPYVIDHLKDAIGQGEKIVCFAWHHDVIEAIAKEFGSAAVTLYGEDSMTARQASVDRFQKDESCRLFVGGIAAAGVGITLTASAHVVFAELDWVPGNITQAEDRCHRIGQTDAVLVQHLVLEGSLDARMAEVLVEKQEVLAAALDDAVGASVPVTAGKSRPATDDMTVKKIEVAAQKLTREQIGAVGEGLIALAGLDGDFAAALNGVGFSKIDVYIGHSLAECAQDGRLTAKQAALGAKLVNKYRRQIPDIAARVTA